MTTNVPGPQRPLVPRRAAATGVDPVRAARRARPGGRRDLLLRRLAQVRGHRRLATRRLDIRVLCEAIEHAMAGSRPPTAAASPVSCRALWVSVRWGHQAPHRETRPSGSRSHPAANSVVSNPTPSAIGPVIANESGIRPSKIDQPVLKLDTRPSSSLGTSVLRNTPRSTIAERRHRPGEQRHEREQPRLLRDRKAGHHQRFNPRLQARNITVMQRRGRPIGEHPRHQHRPDAAGADQTERSAPGVQLVLHQNGSSTSRGRRRQRHARGGQRPPEPCVGAHEPEPLGDLDRVGDDPPARSPAPDTSASRAARRPRPGRFQRQHQRHPDRK